MKSNRKLNFNAMVSSIQSNNFKTSISNVSFSLFNNEIYLSISINSPRKSIVFNRRYWLFLTPMNYATRLRFVTQKQPHE
jgi:hypothetical protein